MVRRARKTWDVTIVGDELNKTDSMNEKKAERGTSMGFAMYLERHSHVMFWRVHYLHIRARGFMSWNGVCVVSFRKTPVTRLMAPRQARYMRKHICIPTVDDLPVQSLKIDWYYVVWHLVRLD